MIRRGIKADSRATGGCVRLRYGTLVRFDKVVGFQLTTGYEIELGGGERGERGSAT